MRRSVKNGIPHAPKARIDAHTGGLGNLLKGHLLIEPHENDFALSGGKTVHHALNIGENLPVDVVTFNAAERNIGTTDIRQVVLLRRLPPPCRCAGCGTSPLSRCGQYA